MQTETEYSIIMIIVKVGMCAGGRKTRKGKIGLRKVDQAWQRMHFHQTTNISLVCSGNLPVILHKVRAILSAYTWTMTAVLVKFQLQKPETI